jgi:hypothetical protein
VEICVHTLHSNGIPTPDVSAGPASPSFLRSTSSNVGSQQDLLSNSGYALSGGNSSTGADSVSIDLRDLETLDPEYPCSNAAGMAEAPQFEHPSDQQGYPTFPYRERSQDDTQQGSTTHLGAQAGIDFILE